MKELLDFLPVIVTLLPFALIVFIIALFNRRIAKKVAIIFGIIIGVIVIIDVTVITRSDNNKLDSSEQTVVEQAAKRDFRDNFVRVDTPAKKTPPFSKSEYLVVVSNYENQDSVDSFISDACDKLNNKDTNLKVQPLHQTSSQPSLIDRECNSL